MDDPDAMDTQERADWFGCVWNHPEPDYQALSFGDSDGHKDNERAAF